MTYYVGAISGTSVDGLDIALLNDSQGLAVPAHTCVAFANKLRTCLMELAKAGSDEIERLGTAHAQLGEFIGSSIRSFVTGVGLKPKDIRAIGCHGQTVRHRPNPIPGFTFQIGDASRIAEITGIDTVADFRSRDIAAGGQGAPLTPVYHFAVFNMPNVARAVLNIGGIANVSLLDGQNRHTVLGFDTGPGNALMDAWMQRQFGRDYDEDGRCAASGSISRSLLDFMLNTEFFDLPPPKSTGKELFNEEFLQNALNHVQVEYHKDVQATLCELTAISISRAITLWCRSASSLTDVIVCGGGRLNRHLMSRLSANLDFCRVVPSEEFNVNGDSLEAAAFAYLAKLFIERRAGNARAATGARGPRVLGCLYPGGGN